MRRFLQPGIALTVLVAACLPRPATPAAPGWDSVKSFVYQLQNVVPEQIAASDCDLAIVDHSSDGSAAGVFTSRQVQQMQRGGRPKRLLAYMSIGEAEPYRFYWQKQWRPGSPTWLEAPNPDWPDNYRVRFWDPLWQAVLLGGPQSYLERIVGAGFDGVYLDIVDGYETYEATRPRARREMVDLVKAIATRARELRPGFGVFPQNALDLANEPDYLECITGVGKESTWFTWGDTPQPPEESRRDEQLLARLVAARKLVLATDYCQRAASIAHVQARARQLGVASYCTTKALDRLLPQP